MSTPRDGLGHSGGGGADGGASEATLHIAELERQVAALHHREAAAADDHRREVAAVRADLRDAHRTCDDYTFRVRTLEERVDAADAAAAQQRDDNAVLALAQRDLERHAQRSDVDQTQCRLLTDANERLRELHEETARKLVAAEVGARDAGRRQGELTARATTSAAEVQRLRHELGAAQERVEAAEEEADELRQQQYHEQPDDSAYYEPDVEAQPSIGAVPSLMLQSNTQGSPDLQAMHASPSSNRPNTARYNTLENGSFGYMPSARGQFEGGRPSYEMHAVPTRTPRPSGLPPRATSASFQSPPKVQVVECGVGNTPPPSDGDDDEPLEPAPRDAIGCPGTCAVM
jgi:hypothetical protein